MRTLMERRRVVHVAEPGGLRVVERWDPPRLYAPWHVNDRPALTCVLRGGLEESLSSGSIECGAHTILFKPPGERHSNRSGPSGAHCLAIELREQHLPSLQAVRRVASPRTNALVSLIIDELHEQDVGAALAAEGLILELLAAIARTPMARAAAARPAWLDGALEELRERFRDPLSVHEVAASAGVTGSHFARVFWRHEGDTPSGYLRRLRVEWAKVQLRRTDRPLAEIAVDAGFADQSHFTRAFVRIEGTTPGRFRSQPS
ncbi:MAG: helix-turn-helix domain-containing protein [bacterium]